MVFQIADEPLRLDVGASRRQSDMLRWDFSMTRPGKCRVVLLSKQIGSMSHPRWDGDGLVGCLVSRNSRQPFAIADQGREDCPAMHDWKLVRTDIGRLTVSEPGPQRIELHDLHVCDSNWNRGALYLVGIRLELMTGSGITAV